MQHVWGTVDSECSPFAPERAYEMKILQLDQIICIRPTPSGRNTRVGLYMLLTTKMAAMSIQCQFREMNATHRAVQM